MRSMLDETVVVEIGQPGQRGVRPVRYRDSGKVLGHIFPTWGKAVIVAMDDWAVAQYCRNNAAAIDWLARNE